MDDSVADFHRKEDPKPTLKRLAFNRPPELTAPEAHQLLDRRCYHPLQQLDDQQEIHAADWQNITVYTHSRPSR